MASTKTLRRPPAHVPPELVYDFAFYADPNPLGGPHAMHLALNDRAAPDVFYTLSDGGHWVIKSRELVEQVMRTPEVFSSNRASPHFETLIGRIETPPQDMDPPDHMPHRLILMRFLGPKQIRQIEPQIRALMVELIDAVVEQGRCDFVKAVSIPYPAKTFMRMMQWDLRRYVDFQRWAAGIINAPTPLHALPHFMRMSWFLRGMLRARMRTPGDDPMSMLLAAEVGGKRLTPKLVHKICNLLFLGGLDTVTTGLSFIAWHLATNPEHQRLLREHPERINSAMEELLRRYAFVNLPRRVAKDAEFHGVRMKQDDYVICSITAASNDERALNGPSGIDFDRKGAPTLLAFNTGPHTCAGANLARLEIRIFLEEWLARVPEFRLAEGHAPRTKSTPLFGMESLQLVW